MFSLRLRSKTTLKRGGGLAIKPSHSAEAPPHAKPQRPRELKNPVCWLFLSLGTRGPMQVLAWYPADLLSARTEHPYNQNIAMGETQVDSGSTLSPTGYNVSYMFTFKCIATLKT